MTRKDYQIIADAIADQLDRESHEGRRAAIIQTAERLAVDLKSDNPRFDTARFLKTCNAR